MSPALTFGFTLVAVLGGVGLTIGVIRHFEDCGSDIKKHTRGKLLNTILPYPKPKQADRDRYDWQEVRYVKEIWECERCKEVWQEDRTENATEYRERTLEVKE